ncbi:hypothetical protein AX279_06065 [Pseudomonas sp. J237]|nr:MULTISPECIES: FUSC family protein [Pseudomonas]OEO26935.1 hypothetical protein AX279_06065 [Pseudomonas sp. J237]
MKAALQKVLGWHAGPPAWGPAIIAGLGCGLPLLLGLFSAHPGFLWAALGAFQASQVNPIHRLGMLRMLLLISLGAWSAGLGLWAAADPVLSLCLFSVFGFLLAWLQRFGTETGKLGISLTICLCMGQGQYGLSSLSNPYAVGMLFILGGLWVMLLAFGQRGLHGMRMWPYMPRFISILKVLWRNAKRQSEYRWRLHALACTLAFGLAGLSVNLTGISHGHWMTLAVLGTLPLNWATGLLNTLRPHFVTLCTAILIFLFGYSLHNPAIMVATVLPLIVFCRALQAHEYGAYVLQIAVCFLLLAESLSRDWQIAPTRLLNSTIGVVISVVITLLIYACAHWLRGRNTQTGSYKTK